MQFKLLQNGCKYSAVLASMASNFPRDKGILVSHIMKNSNRKDYFEMCDFN